MYEMFMRVVDTVKRMPPNLRFFVVLSLIVVGGGTALIYTWANHISYSVLYGNLATEDIAGVAEELDRLNIDYRVSNSGSSISVADGKVGEIRVRLAAAGLPSGGVIGYELFDKSSMGMTEYIQKLNYRRALEGELTRTISGLSEVAAARVHIVIPEQKLFVEDEVPPTASVVIKLRAGAHLDKRKVNGIMQLVAASIEGLHPENVTLLDYGGNLLSPNQAGDPSVTLSARQLDLQKSVESYLQAKAQSLLDGVLGPNRAIVRANAKLNFERVEKTIEEYDPDNPAILSQERNEETSSDNSKTIDGATSGGQNRKDNSVINYEINKTVQHIVAETGNIKKLSVSVIVDGIYTAVEGGDGDPVFAPRSPEELGRLESVVKNAVGFDETRQDGFEIVSIQFDREYFKQEQQELDALEQRNFYMDLGYKALQGLGILLALFILFRFWKKTTRMIKEWIPPAPPKAKPAPLKAPTIEDEVAEPIQAEKRKLKLTDQMTQVAQDRPDEIAKVIRTMMIEE